MKKLLKSAQRRTAHERMEQLFEQASARPSFARRYVSLARALGRRYKVSVPKKWRSRVCKSCNALFLPGLNCRVRVRVGKTVYTCLECKKVKRFPR